jgi:hypothetical protein
MNRPISLVILAAVLLLLPLRRLPAPIQEIPEATPAPTSARTPKAKKSSAKGKASTTPNESAKKTSKQPVGASRFTGKWVGTMPEVPWGDVATELIIDQTGTTMQWQESGKQKATARATVNGDTLQANFQVGVAETWSLTPQGDGTTARVRLQAFMNDQTAIFHRASTR